MFPYQIALPKNYLLAAIHLFTWLLWHPTAWKTYLKNLDDKILPDFSLLHLSYEQWKEPSIQKLLVLAFAILPILVMLFVFSIAYWFNTHENLLSTISYTLMITLTSCWVGSIALSFVFGIVFSTTTGLLLGSYLGFLIKILPVEPIAIVVGIALFSLSFSINCFNQFSTVLMPFRYLESNLNDNLIKPGQQLKVKAPVNVKTASQTQNTTKTTTQTTNTTKVIYHTVQKGDTLWSIASKYNITIDELKKNNNIKNNSLVVGEKLKIKS